MIIALTCGDPLRTVSATRWLARADDCCGFLPRRVACAAEDAVRSAFAEGLFECLTELLVLRFQVSDALSRGLQPPQ